MCEKILFELSGPHTGVLVERICATLGYINFPKMLKLMLLCGLFLAGVLW